MLGSGNPRHNVTAAYMSRSCLPGRDLTEVLTASRPAGGIYFAYLAGSAQLHVAVRFCYGGSLLSTDINRIAVAPAYAPAPVQSPEKEDWLRPSVAVANTESMPQSACPLSAD